MASIAEELQDLINPDPSFDPEDDIHEETRAKLVDRKLVNQDTDYPLPAEKNVGLRKSLGFMRDEEPMYNGKIVSRKDMFDDVAMSGEDETDADSIDSVDESDDIDEDRPESEEEIESEEVAHPGEDEEIDSDEAMNSEDEEKYAPGMFKKEKSTVTEAMKGKDTLNQLNLWESLLETRIKVQKLLGLASQLPRPTTYPKFEEAGADVSMAIKTATKSLTKLGSAMFTLQGGLLRETEDDKDGSERSDNEEEKPLKTGNAFDTAAWDDQLKKRSSHLKNRRNKTLQFWYDKTLLTSGKAKDKSFSSFERPTVAQIEHILADRDRLIRRTQLQRSSYRVLGTSSADGRGDTDKSEHNAHLKQVDEETFDDDDFYQQLLRQFIEQKTSASVSGGNLGDSVEMTRNWLKLQHLKTKTKKIVDTKASKGRKVRYEVHPKLVSYMAPCDGSSWTHESRNQLVKSIFGKSFLLDNDS